MDHVFAPNMVPWSPLVAEAAAATATKRQSSTTCKYIHIDSQKPVAGVPPPPPTAGALSEQKSR